MGGIHSADREMGESKIEKDGDDKKRFKKSPSDH
jgi:hypothetical protein